MNKPFAITPIFLAFVTCALNGCGSETTDSGTPEVTIHFAVESGGSPLNCTSSFSAGTGSGSLGISDLKMYISEVELITTDGTAVSMALSADEQWQTESIALLDFEDRSGGCTNGTTDTNTTIRGSVPEGTYTGISFRVGVPFSENHADPTSASGPLTYMSMHWGWQGGYKFLRADVTEEDGSFRFHLGSTGCEGTIGAITECTRPNRPYIELTQFDWATQSIILNIDQLFAETDLTANAEGTTLGCMASEIDPDCSGPFNSLGLDLQSGDVSHTASAFTVK